MARTHKNLWPAITDFSALVQAFHRTAQGRRRQRDVIAYKSRLEPNIFDLQEALEADTYRTGPYHTFHVYEPKKRLVASLPIKDRVAQHSLIAQIQPIFERSMIDQSYACRVGGGTHRGADQVQAYLRATQRRSGQVYVLKADIRKYFPSVDQARLIAMLERRIACPKTLNMCAEILASSYTPGHPGFGIPIGNLTSQLFANVYLNALDHFIKRELRARQYVRYMDDFVIISDDKQALHGLRCQIAEFLADSLGLVMNNKTQVYPVHRHHGRGVDFLGYRIWPTHRKLRKDCIRRMRRKMRRMSRAYAMGTIDLSDVAPVVQSWIGHAQKADSYTSRTHVLGFYGFQRRHHALPQSA